ncbi:hypothetical protein AAC387_Pa07g0597 [Persea americana]
MCSQCPKSMRYIINPSGESVSKYNRDSQNKQKSEQIKAYQGYYNNQSRSKISKPKPLAFLAFLKQKTLESIKNTNKLDLANEARERKARERGKRLLLLLRSWLHAAGSREREARRGWESREKGDKRRGLGVERPES